MTGAKLGQRVGWVRIFRVVVVVFALSSLLMIFSPTVARAIAGQALAGASAAIIVPALVALVAENYSGDQQATAIGSLGSARALAGVSAFLIGGTLGTLVGWRPVFWIVFAIAIAVFALSFTLRSDKGDPSVTIDVVAAVLIGLAIMSLTLGFNNLNAWGAFVAGPGAPFELAGISPALMLIVTGVILGQAFFLWTRRRMREGKVPLVDLSVLGSARECAAVYAMFIVVALEAALNFTATLIVRFYKRFSPRTIGVAAFTLATAALVWLSFVVNNNWETLPTITGLVAFGIGQGALVTLVFNVLVTSAPAELAGDVGSLRGSTQNLASAVGTAMVGAMLVALLSVGIGRAVVEHPSLPPELIAQVDLDSVNFVSNEDLHAVLSRTDATEEQVAYAVQLNEEERLRALKTGLLILAGISAMAILPASRLPRYRPHEIPADQLT